MDLDMALSPCRERALDHIAVHMESALCGVDASPRDSKMVKGLEVVVTEITELQCELEATGLDTSLNSDKPKIHELKEINEMDELAYADADMAVEDGVSEEATSFESEADACFTEEEEPDQPEVEGNDVTTEVVGIIGKVENAQHDEVVKNLGTIWIAPGKTAWLAAWLEEAAYWEGMGPGGSGELEMIGMRRLKRFNTM